MGLRKFFRSKRKLPLEKMVRVGDFQLHANYDHPIEEYLTQFKYYSRNFPRIAKYIEAKYGVYKIIDVGANIGDSAALLRSFGVGQFVHLFEGDPTYIKLLEKNISLFSDVEVHPTYLGEENVKVNISIDNTRGTANITTSDKGEEMTIVRLDQIVAERNIQNIKLLKTDTDGFDFKILRGSFETIIRDKPVLFFEYDAVFLAQQNDDGLSIFKNLKDFGYNTLLYYDNFGKFLISTTIEQTALIEQLYGYINRKESAFPYYDVVMFHKDDEQLAKTVIERERQFFS